MWYSKNIWPAKYIFTNLYLAQKYGQYGPGITTPDMEDVKESVKQGVSKVAGRLSGMASGVMTQLQVRLTEILKRFLNILN